VAAANADDMAAVGHRLPPTAQLRALLVALALGLALTAGWELFLRAQGYRPPSEGDNLEQTADTVRALDKVDVLILGSSRTRIGVDPDSVNETLQGRRARTATLPATNSLQLLRLAMAEDNLPPVIALEVLPGVFYRDLDSASTQAARTLLARPVWYSAPEAAYGRMRRKLALAGGRASPAEVIREELRVTLGLQQEAAHDPAYVEHPSGWLELRPTPAYLEFAKLDMAHAARVARTRERHITRAEIDRLLETLHLLDAELQQRGCTLLFFQPPADGQWSEVEEEFFPRQATWDRIAQAFPGRTLHYQDNPATSGYTLPDGSHLVGPDAKDYSRHLGHWLSQHRR
jgi:hypothetical protein